MNSINKVVMGKFPITTIQLEQRKHNRLIVTVPSLIPMFMMPFYMDTPHALPWLYVKDTTNYLGKLPVYYFQTPIQLLTERHKYQETPMIIHTHYLIPEPDKEYTYIAMRVYKSMYIPIVFSLIKNKHGTYMPKFKDAYDYLAFTFNAKRDQIQRLKKYISKHYYNTSVIFPVVHGIPMNKTSAIDMTTMYGSDNND